MRPIIGLSSYYVKAYEFSADRVRGLRDQDMLMTTMDYVESIYSAGGAALSISPIDSEDYLRTVVARIDGLLLTGGGDVNPRSYDQSLQKGIGRLEVERDVIELKLIEYALQRGIPIMGICRGHQLLNVYFKGTLYQDINRHSERPIEHVARQGLKSTEAHRVIFVRDCPLKRCFGRDEIYVNSFHHQAIDRLGEGLAICARSEDGYIEAIECENNPQVFGVQWHPEMMSRVAPDQMRIFEMLIEYASQNKERV